MICSGVGKFVLWGLDWGVPSPSHFMKVARSVKAHPLFQERPSAYLSESLDHGYFVILILNPKYGNPNYK